MAAGLHANVGLMHATMAIFNAFCDRVPMLIGSARPARSTPPSRRPWIDWIHTAADQGALVRDFVKWDDQPASAAAAVEALARADQLTRTHPSAPVYVCLDAALQESELAPGLALPDLARHRAPAPPEPARADVEAAAAILAAAERPVLLAGRTGRGEAEWEARVRLAERLGARVLTDLKAAAAFPTRHPLHAAAPGTFLTPSGGELIRSADAILALDWIDVGGTLATAYDGAAPPARVISCTRRPRAAQRLEQGPLRAAAGGRQHRGPPRPARRRAARARRRERGRRGLRRRRSRRAAAASPALRRRAVAPRPRHRAAHRARRARHVPGPPPAHLGRRRARHRPPARLPRPGRRGRARRPGRAWRSARRSRCAGRTACRSPCSATATSSWARPRCGPPPATACRCSSSSPTTARTSTTRSTRSASRAAAGGPSRTAGSASRSATRTPISPSLARSLGLRGHGPVTTEDVLERRARGRGAGGRGRRRGARRCAGRRGRPGELSVRPPRRPRRCSSPRARRAR